jgi:hypothetical protein
MSAAMVPASVGDGFNLLIAPRMSAISMSPQSAAGACAAVMIRGSTPQVLFLGCFAIEEDVILTFISSMHFLASGIAQTLRHSKQYLNTVQ